MINAAPAETAKPRERIPYRINGVVQALRDMARETDTQLEDVTAEVMAALEIDGVIDADEAQSILITLVHAFKENANALNVLNLLDESGSEAAQREVERIQSKRLKRARK